MNWFQHINWGDAPTWVGGVGTILALAFAGNQLRLDRHQREDEEKLRRADELQRREDQNRSQLSSLHDATADLFGVAVHISMLANAYGIRRAAYERSWTPWPGRWFTATFYGERLLNDVVAASERLMVAYHRLRFSSFDKPLVEAAQHLVDVVNATIASATGNDKWDMAPTAKALEEASNGVLGLVPRRSDLAEVDSEERP
jgi:hypothetical protein